jgi:hypothetical protein
MTTSDRSTTPNKLTPVDEWSETSKKIFCFFWLGMYTAVLWSYVSNSSSITIPDPTEINEFDVGKVSQMLTTLLLISAFLERAIEVYVLTFRKQQEVKIDLNIKRLKLSLRLVDRLAVDGTDFENEVTLIEEIFPIEDEEIKKIFVALYSGAVADRNNAKIILQEKINMIVNNKDKIVNNYKSTTRSYTLWSALLLGILISLIGIRGIGTFTILGSGEGWGNNWFKIVDIFLTGAVIAGGSDFIHKILQVVTTFMEAIATSNKAVAAASVDGTKP